MIADQACAERGCACHDYREGPGVEMVRREWQGLTSQEVYACADEAALPQELSTGCLQAFGQAIEARLKEKNT